MQLKRMGGYLYCHTKYGSNINAKTALLLSGNGASTIGAMSYRR